MGVKRICHFSLINIFNSLTTLSLLARVEGPWAAKPLFCLTLYVTLVPSTTCPQCAVEIGVVSDEKVEILVLPCVTSRVAATAACLVGVAVAAVPGVTIIFL